MTDIIRYEPYFARYLFSNEGELYVVDGPLEPEDGALIVMQDSNPHNGLSIPVRVQIQVTNHCNLRCPHCYAASGVRRPNELSDSDIHSFLQECQQSGVLQIEWSGGEPFTRKGFIDLMSFAHSLGFEQNLLTNGVAFGRKTQLVKEAWKYMHSVQVSMNGYGDKFDQWVGKRSWNSVLSGIERLVVEKPEYGRVSVATTLDWTNLPDLESIGTLLSELGVNTWGLARQVHNGRSLVNEDEADEQLHKSYAILQDMRMRKVKLPSQVLHPFDKGEPEDEEVFPVEWITEPAARTFLYVSAIGDVYPFPFYDGCIEWMSGSIRTASLIELWHSEPFARVRAVTREHTGCGGCKKICQLWSRWFNYGRGMNINESPIVHYTCTRRP